MSDNVKASLAAWLVASLLAVAASCTPAREPPSPHVLPPTSCREACDQAALLCGPGALRPKTGTCYDVCAATESAGGDFRTGCLAASTSCADVEACSR